ncbi:MAG: hypothetical protein DHS20C13_09080 [Thermodesulfobacteriota bacterium]|nr:MAG: hypothetical protein DHS20C13_09080 [Thermodesulfobacteriota bacterium]
MCIELHSCNIKLYAWKRGIYELTQIIRARFKFADKIENNYLYTENDQRREKTKRR